MNDTKAREAAKKEIFSVFDKDDFDNDLTTCNVVSDNDKHTYQVTYEFFPNKSTKLGIWYYTDTNKSLINATVTEFTHGKDNKDGKFEEAGKTFMNTELGDKVLPAAKQYLTEVLNSQSK